LQPVRRYADDLADAEAVVIERRLVFQIDHLLIGITPEFFVDEGLACRGFQQGDLDLNDVFAKDGSRPQRVGMGSGAHRFCLGTPRQ
jgi:hypothetical protein